MRPPALLLLSSLLATPFAFAHGGDDHREGSSIASIGERSHSTSGVGEVWEILLRYAPTPAGRPMDLTLFVADTKTNEPISGVELELTFTGKGEFKVTSAATDTPGVYVASALFPTEGEFDAVAFAARGEDSDLITLGAVRVGLAASGTGDAHAHTGSGWMFVVAGVGAVLVVAVCAVLIRSHRSRRRVGGPDNA